MSPQDSQLLQDFLNQLVQARGVAKDAEAEAMISRAVSQQPDAAYLLVQRALLQQQALNNAKAEIAALQDQLRSGAQGKPAFLDPNAWGNSGAARSSSSAAPVAPQQYQPPYQQPYQQPYPGSLQGPGPGSTGGFLRGGLGGMGGGMLGNIAATAAGVAGGAFLFQGLEHLLGHHSGNGFLGPQSALTSPTETSTTSIDHDSASSSNQTLADKLGSDEVPGSGGGTGNSLFDSTADSGNSLSDDLAGDVDSGFDDGGDDDGLFS
jgi:hypothetical protein